VPCATAKPQVVHGLRLNGCSRKTGVGCAFGVPVTRTELILIIERFNLNPAGLILARLT
jgi:hypothetical protein